MKYAKLTRDFYKTTICSLFFFVVTMAILPGDLYAQANSRLTYIPDDWAGGSSCSIKSINKNIRITSVSFEAGPYATTIFGQQPTYSQHSTNALRFTKLKEVLDISKKTEELKDKNYILKVKRNRHYKIFCHFS